MSTESDAVRLWVNTVGDSGEAPTDAELHTFALAVRDLVLKAVLDELEPHLSIVRSFVPDSLDRFRRGMERAAEVVAGLEQIWTDDEGQPALPRVP